MLVGASCTAELIQDDPGGLARALALPIPVVPLELPVVPAQGELGRGGDVLSARARARGTVGAAAGHARAPRGRRAPSVAATCWARPRSASAIATTSREITTLLDALGIDVNVVAPLGASPADLARLPRGRLQRRALSGDRGHRGAVAGAHVRAAVHARRCRSASAPRATSSREVAALAGVDPAPVLAGAPSRLPWYSRSVDSTYLTGKRVFVFGDATHAVAAARDRGARTGFTVVGLGTYSREFAREVREAREALRRRAADHRRLSRGRGADRRTAARAGARHADGAPHRQAARASRAR